MEEKPQKNRSLSRNPVYLSLGSNLGDREINLLKAREMLAVRCGEENAVSSLFESASWGFRSSHPFYNCCLSISTSLSPFPLLETILEIEREMGRIREKGRYTDRTIDIDILFFGNEVREHPRLTIPHPSMEQRRFVLVLLAEVAPGFPHPVTGLTILEMLERCADPVQVTRVEFQPRWKSRPSQNM